MRNNKETREIAPREPGLPTELVARLQEYDVFGQAEPGELVLPVWRLVQGTTRTADARRAGWFYNPVLDDYKEELHVAIFARRKSRSLFAEGDFGSPPLCASDDGIRPRQTVVVGGVQTGPTCAECPFSQWGSARGGSGRGQACRLADNLLCYDLEEGEANWGVGVLRVTGVSLGPWRRYLTGGRFSRLPSAAVETVVTAELQRFEAGQAYVMRFRRGGVLRPETMRLVTEIALSYGGAQVPVEGEEAGEMEELLDEAPRDRAEPRREVEGEAPRRRRLFDE